MRKRTFFGVGGLLVTVACADPTGPTVDAPFDQFAAVTRAAGENGGDVYSHILEQSLTTPRLETYELKFWVVRGESKQVLIRYQSLTGDVGDDENDPAGDRVSDGDVHGEVFLSLYFLPYALQFHPDGTPIAWGERVPLTISVDPRRLLVSFEPSGLVFNRWQRPVLDLSYAGADRDLDGDGDADVVDDYVEGNYLTLWVRTPALSGAAADLSRQAGGQDEKQWTPEEADRKKKESKTLTATIKVTSDVAVSW